MYEENLLLIRYPPPPLAWKIYEEALMYGARSADEMVVWAVIQSENRQASARAPESGFRLQTQKLRALVYFYFVIFCGLQAEVQSGTGITRRGFL